MTWPPDDDDDHRGHHRELWDEQAARAEHDEPTDQDLVADHPFEASPWPDTCGHVYANGWQCGYAKAEHEREG